MVSQFREYNTCKFQVYFQYLPWFYYEYSENIALLLLVQYILYICLCFCKKILHFTPVYRPIWYLAVYGILYMLFAMVCLHQHTTQVMKSSRECIMQQPIKYGEPSTVMCYITPPSLTNMLEWHFRLHPRQTIVNCTEKMSTMYYFPQDNLVLCEQLNNSQGF